MCYSPVRHSLQPCGQRTFDLHVLGTPPAFILSQDQTRHPISMSSSPLRGAVMHWYISQYRDMKQVCSESTGLLILLFGSLPLFSCSSAVPVLSHLMRLPIYYRA